jgi:hypothetical protein
MISFRLPAAVAVPLPMTELQQPCIPRKSEKCTMGCPQIRDGPLAGRSPSSTQVKRTDLDAERCNFLRERPRETADSPLGGMVTGAARACQAAAYGRYLQDVAALLFSHDRQHGTGHVDHAIELRGDSPSGRQFRIRYRNSRSTFGTVHGTGPAGIILVK